ncbi:MAG: mechanosensitive ion channel family protein [Anaeroplasma sp.]
MINNILYETETATTTAVTTTVTEVNDGVVFLEKLLDKAISWVTSTGIKIVIALIILVILFKVINVLTKKLATRLEKKQADATLSRVLVSALRICCKSLVLLCLVGYVGIETASISAVIASLGVGISLAVQGTLSNFAGGVIIIIMRPFKLGDYITSNGSSGTVEDIKLFYTSIVTPDNKVIYIPNGTLANNVIVNNSVKDSRRCDVVMGISYDSNVELAKNLISKVCSKSELIYKDKAPFIEVGEYGDSSINIYVRVWCKNGDYWTVYYYLLKEIKEEFDANGIEIPFNQVDVNIKNS